MKSGQLWSYRTRPHRSLTYLQNAQVLWQAWPFSHAFDRWVVSYHLGTTGLRPACQREPFTRFRPHHYPQTDFYTKVVPCSLLTLLSSWALPMIRLRSYLRLGRWLGTHHWDSSRHSTSWRAIWCYVRSSRTKSTGKRCQQRLGWWEWKQLPWTCRPDRLFSPPLSSYW